MEQILDINNAVDFFYGGKAEFVIQSKETAKSFSYSVYGLDTDSGKIYFVCAILNQRRIFIGSIFNKKEFKFSTKAYTENITANSLVVKSFKWLFEVLKYKSIQHFHKIKFYHTGKCGKCGRILTNPESIKIGIGPVCVSK